MNSCGTDSASVNFTKAGFYTVDLAYSNGLYGNYEGGASFNFTTSGAAVSLSQTVAAVPEPESYAMLLAGLGLMGAIAKRRKAKQA